MDGEPRLGYWRGGWLDAACLKLPTRRQGHFLTSRKGDDDHREGGSDRATVKGPLTPNKMNESTPDPLRYLIDKGERQEGSQGGPGIPGQ